MAHFGPKRCILIKFGGNALSGEGDLKRFGEDIALLMSRGFQPVLVHGGGPEISQEMERRGLRVVKAAGLRVTDDAALKVASEVLGRLNSDIVGALRLAGVPAQGTSAANIGVVCFKKLPVTVKENGTEREVDLGNVGDVDHVHEARLHLMMARNEVPVIYPIGADPSGNLLNVNADTVAAYVAHSIGAEEMVLMTDVPGLLRSGEGGKEVIPSATLERIDELISEGVITGGMIPKVDACRVALVHGVRTVHMLNGKEHHSMVRKLLNSEEIGTTITQG